MLVLIMVLTLVVEGLLWWTWIESAQQGIDYLSGLLLAKTIDLVAIETDSILQRPEKVCMLLTDLSARGIIDIQKSYFNHQELLAISAAVLNIMRANSQVTTVSPSSAANCILQVPWMSLATENGQFAGGMPLVHSVSLLLTTLPNHRRHCEFGPPDGYPEEQQCRLFPYI